MLTVLVGFGRDAAAFDNMVLWAVLMVWKKIALRHMCMCPFAVKIGDKYALIILCVAEGILQFMVRELCPGSKFLFMV